MTNEQIQALAARLWLKANEAKQSDDWGCDSDNFHDVATPDAILSLLAEREADKALIAELKSDVEDAEHRRDMALKNGEALVGRIVELETRTLTVDLQYERFAYGESDYDDGHARGWNAHKIEVEKALRQACAAAGITLVVGGEDATK